MGYIQAIRHFIEIHVRIVNEPEELLVSPLRMLWEIELVGYTSGDCDDIAMLIAAFFGAVGIEARFKAIMKTSEGWYQHVFTEYRLQTHKHMQIWRSCDPSAAAIPVYDSGDFLIENV